MDRDGFLNRARGAVVGLAVGDALGAASEEIRKQEDW